MRRYDMKGFFPKKQKIKKILVRTAATYMALAVFSIGIPVAYAAISADIKANGSDGPVTINDGDSWNYTWTSDSATACTLTAPTGDSGISLSGSGGPIDSGHPWYPAVGTPTTLTLNCTNGSNTASDSVVINLVATPPPPTPPPPAPTGKITFCLILADKDNVIATSTAGLPAGIFSINLDSNTGTGTTTIQTKLWTTATFSTNARFILPSENDADCVTYDNLAFGAYGYSPLSVTGANWQIAKYNDQNTQPVNDVLDFFNFNQNSNSDGSIVLTTARPEQTLVIFETDDVGEACPAPQITSVTADSAVVGQPYTYTITASSTTATSFSATNLPTRWSLPLILRVEVGEAAEVVAVEGEAAVEAGEAVEVAGVHLPVKCLALPPYPISALTFRVICAWVIAMTQCKSSSFRLS